MRNLYRALPGVFVVAIAIGSPTLIAHAGKSDGVVAYVADDAIHLVAERGNPVKLSDRSGPSLAWAPDGSALAFIDGDLTILDARTGHPTQSVRGADDSPSFDAQGNLWFRNDGALYRMRVGGSPTRVDARCGDGEGEISPDGKWFAYADASAIRVCATDGRNVDRSVADVVGAGAPRWSPDAKRLAVENATGQIAIVELDGGAKEIGSGSDPDWSLDGERIVFSEGDALMVMNRNGISRTAFASNVSGSSPSWGRGQVSAASKKNSKHAARPAPAARVSEMQPVADEVPVGGAEVEVTEGDPERTKKPKRTKDPQDVDVAYGAPIMPPAIAEERDRLPLMAAVAAAAGMVTAGSGMLLWYFRRGGFR